MERAVRRRQSLDRQDGAIVDLRQQHQAGIDGAILHGAVDLAAEDNGAGAAIALRAALLGSGEIGAGAQPVEHRHGRRRARLAAWLSVQQEPHFCHDDAQGLSRAVRAATASMLCKARTTWQTALADGGPSHEGSTFAHFFSSKCRLGLGMVSVGCARGMNAAPAAPDALPPRGRDASYASTVTLSMRQLPDERQPVRNSKEARRRETITAAPDPRPGVRP